MSETSDPETFTTCISWLRRKLTSTLPDEIDWSEAASLSDSVEIYGEHLTEGVPDDVDLIRLAKDASELPRDRSIWPATNLVLAWTQARKLRAKSPRTLLLACADLHTKELVSELPKLEPGELVLGPVFFGFSLNRENSSE